MDHTSDIHYQWLQIEEAIPKVNCTPSSRQYKK